MQALVDAVSCFIGWIAAAFTQVFIDFGEAVSDIFIFLFDAAGDLVISALASFDFAPLLEITSYWSSIPPLAIDVISAIGLHQAFMIIVGALVIRFLLQLIPFVRLGS